MGCRGRGRVVVVLGTVVVARAAVVVVVGGAVVVGAGGTVVVVGGAVVVVGAGGTVVVVGGTVTVVVVPLPLVVVVGQMPVGEQMVVAADEPVAPCGVATAPAAHMAMMPALISALTAIPDQSRHPLPLTSPSSPRQPPCLRFRRFCRSSGGT